MTMDPDRALVVADERFTVASSSDDPLDQALFSLASEVRYFRQRFYDTDNKWDVLGCKVHELKAIGRIEWNSALNRILKEMFELDINPPKQRPIVLSPNSGEVQHR